MTAHLEDEVINFAESDERTCAVCLQETSPDHAFLTGIQEPGTKVVALIAVCRSCFVCETGGNLRGVLDKHWYAKRS